MNTMLTAALFYHAEGRCVIPVAPRDKRPALPTWEEYQTRCSTEVEVRDWFSSSAGYNVGIVHGAVSGNYVTLDFDHDAGMFEEMRRAFPALFTGRLEQSGSQAGYHLPLCLDVLPDFGQDTRQGRPRGNRTWKTERGDVNVRAGYCQTVAPPSIHPTGNPYRFIQRGAVAMAHDLDDVIDWLNTQAPPTVKAPPGGNAPRPVHPVQGSDLIGAVQAAWPTAVAVFEHFGLTGERRTEHNGELRLLGHGGLLIAAEDPGRWYNFSDECGGHIIEAWDWGRFGSSYDKARHFRQVLLEMAQAAGIDTAQFYRRGDERVTRPATGDRQYWDRQRNAWGQVREAA